MRTVAHGCADKRMDDLAWYAPALVEAKFISHDRWVFLPFVMPSAGGSGPKPAAAIGVRPTALSEMLSMSCISRR